MLMEVNHLVKNFGGVAAVRDVSLCVDKNQIVSIIGPNGAGKTTVFNLISGVYRLNEGEILFEGVNLVGKPQHEIARLGIARTFQNIRLFKGLTVMENVMTALDSISSYNIVSAMVGLPGKRKTDRNNQERAADALKLVHMYDYRDEKPANLSYGMQRRVELARAIVTVPKLLLLDEPAAGLNPNEVLEFIENITELKEKLRFGIIIIEHRMQVVNDLSQRIYVLNFGSLLACGTPEEIQKNPEVIIAYIGEDEDKC